MNQITERDFIDFRYDLFQKLDKLTGMLEQMREPVQKPRKPREGDVIRIIQRGNHVPQTHIGDVQLIRRTDLDGWVYTNRDNRFMPSMFGEFEILGNING